MAPIVKDVENPTATSTTTVPANPVAAPARPQPIPLEVPVSVNGARTIEGTDKREPFSEATKTVLVFANGAVIRLASSVAPGQLLFVTNDKTKKEVVCQVVKSKNYGTVTGYVELEFTEPAVGFWGMRIPADQVAPTAAVPKAPVGPRPVAPSVPVAPAAALPKVAAPAPALPVATKPNIPAVAPVKPAIAPPPSASSVAPKPEAVKPPAPAPVIAAIPVKVTPVVLPVSQVPVQPVIPPQSVPAKTDALPAQLAAQLSSLLTPRIGDAASGAHVQAVEPEVAKPLAAQPPVDATTEELRQQAARLQEQLSSLLFRKSAQEKAAAPVLAPTPIAPTIVVPTIPVAAQPSVEKAPTIPQATAEAKAAPIFSKTSSISLPVEEVKIPSWLAPIARETETTTQTPPASEANSAPAAEGTSYETSEELHSGVDGISSQNPQSVVFGGQLLGGSAGTETQDSSAGSKKGLVFGLAAAAVLAAAGGVWYGLQPGNFLASNSAPKPTAQTSSLAANDAALKTEVTAAASTPNSTTSAAASPVASGRSTTTSPASVTPAETNRALNLVSSPETKAANNASKTVASAPVGEQPKKPVLGDVHLATPTVSRKVSSANNEVAPSIDGAEATTEGDPLAGLAENHSKQPAAPLPVGGDVKPAHLLKSTPPIYPATARSQRISGDVQLDALIDAAGNVTATKVISGPTLLHQAATAAVKQWKYEPAQLDGKATSMHLTVTVQFRLQ